MSKTKIALYFGITLATLVFAACLPVPSNALQFSAQNRASLAAQRQSDSHTRIINRADTMIAIRLDSLQKLLARVSSDKRLSDTDKTNIENDINETIQSLTSLKTKINADTDVATARADAKSIVTTYKIYVYFEPKIRLLTTIGNLQTITTSISTLSAKVQTLLTTLQSQSKDVTSAQTALTDITTQLTAINTLLSTDKTLLGNITIQTTNPQSIFVQVRKDLATVRSDLAKIRADFATIRNTIKLNTTPKNASASAK